MSIMTALGETATVAKGRGSKATPACLITTLYDLITVIQDAVSLEDDALVVDTVVHLLRSGRLTLLRTASMQERRKA
jgi:hypothetical protein